jgi:hypothetical protein
MKLNSLAPNARYDLEHGKPSVFEQDNDGSNLYRYNIEPEMGIPDGQTEEIQVGWQCREIRIWNKPTKANLKKSIIRSIVDESAEFDIVNSYNKHVLGIKLDTTAVDNYKEYLQFTEDLDAMLVSDFSTLNE